MKFLLRACYAIARWKALVKKMETADLNNHFTLNIMKKLSISILALLMMVSCQITVLAPEYVHADDDLYASIEPVNATKTVMDENNNILWSEGDQLVAFMKTTLGMKYQIKEQYVGTSTGGFSKIEEQGNDDDLESGQEIDHNVVLYPHSTSVWCMKNDSNTPAQSYKLNVVLPETQVYEENSFGMGAFPMIAVSTDNKLTFRNICGGLKLQFKGVDKIRSIRLEGLGNEKISGKSTVVGYVNGSAPSITMADNDKSYTHVILDCGEGVQLSETTPTTFIIAVPPVEFASGMKITVTDTDGLSRTLTNTSPNTIKRSCLTRFPVITYRQDGVFELPEGTLTSYEIPAEGGIVEIPVTTNQEYEVVIPEEAKDWISYVDSKVIRNEVISINIEENVLTSERSAEVLICSYNSEIVQTITITQLRVAPYIEFEKDSIELPFESSESVFTFNTNMKEFDVAVSGSASWLTVTPDFSNNTIKVSATENIDKQRSVSVSIKDKENSLIGTLTVIQEGYYFDTNQCLYYCANQTGGWDSGYENYRSTSSFFRCGVGGSTIEMKFKLASLWNRSMYLAAGSNLAKDYCDEFVITQSGLSIYIDIDEDNGFYNSWSWTDLGVSPTDLITLRLSASEEKLTINGKTFSCPDMPDMYWSYIFSNYYREYDEGEWKEYEGLPEGSALYYVKMYDAKGNVTYVGHPKSYVNSNTGRNEFYWYSNTASQSVRRQYANDYLSQGGYSGN